MTKTLASKYPLVVNAWFQRQVLKGRAVDAKNLDVETGHESDHQPARKVFGSTKPAGLVL